MKDFRLDGKRALISGGSKGLGAAIAERFSEAGADIGVIGRDRDGLSRVKSVVENNHRNCCVIEEDVSSIEGARRAGDKALALSPEWDVLVNNAGIARVQSILETTQDDWNDIFSVNLRSALLLSQAIVPQMIKRGHGKVVLFLASPASNFVQGVSLPLDGGMTIAP